MSKSLKHIREKDHDPMPNSVLFEPVFNLVYCLKHFVSPPPPKAKKSLLGSRDSTEENVEEQYSNVFIWDIQTQQQTALFDEKQAANERLASIKYETRYDVQQRTMLFNRSTALFNHTNLDPRPPVDALLLLTYPKETLEIRHLWMASKKGTHLRKVAVLDAQTKWHLDVGNQLLRLLRHGERSITIEEIPWIGIPQ